MRSSQRTLTNARDRRLRSHSGKRVIAHRRRWWHRRCTGAMQEDTVMNFSTARLPKFAFVGFAIALASCVEPTTESTPAEGVDDSTPLGLSFASEADASVLSAQPDRNYGRTTRLYVDNSPLWRSYMRFQVSGVSGSVQSAKLRVYCTNGSKDGPAI